MNFFSATLDALISVSEWSAAGPHVRHLLLNILANLLLEILKVFNIHNENSCASVGQCTENLWSKSGEIIANNYFFKRNFPMETTRNLMSNNFVCTFIIEKLLLSRGALFLITTIGQLGLILFFLCWQECKHICSNFALFKKIRNKKWTGRLVRGRQT